MGAVELYEFMIARCAPENLDDAYVKYSDYAALESKLTAQAELIASLQAALKEADERVAGLLAEVKRLRDQIAFIYKIHPFLRDELGGAE